ncbi:MAG: Trehalose-6-phosphate synthase [Acidimicrobiales bacterium]|nr:MAG: trehalose-6-phosphate synthase [Actinomycetota bacterium]MBV6508491.1 Trehalose-6-phosphate synthase [Acidimicrobiales bacterium]RIK05191.1 MAG: trehalose-6-phosphate synthase [Acidobacteriota bacterium]
MSDPPLVIVSNRGPFSFRVRDGQLVASRGAGGLASGLVPVLESSGALWIASAMSEGDHAAAARGVTETHGLFVKMLAIDRAVFADAYDVVSNGTLWYLHHGLFDAWRTPVLDVSWHRAWNAYRRFNQTMAVAAGEEAPPDAVVLVQDYHLSLFATYLHELRPDLRTVHFHHTPFCAPDSLRMLPSAVRGELIEGLLANGACGFHTRRWAESFERCCREVVGADATGFVSPLAPDSSRLASAAGGRECAVELRRLSAAIGDRSFIARVDRLEPSKNLLRGFRAYDDLLRRYPHWRQEVVFGAFLYPSREAIEDYRLYRDEVLATVEAINRRWGRDGWDPIVLDVSDNYSLSLAALRRFDVLLVNPVRDGLNLVAMEGALVNEHDGSVLLSTEAGAHAMLEGSVDSLDPFDEASTADALDRALGRSQNERTERFASLRRQVAGQVPGDWLRRQLAAIGAG